MEDKNEVNDAGLTNQMGGILLGEILVKNGQLTTEQLELALAEQEKVGGVLGKLIQLVGYASEGAILKALAHQAMVEVINLDVYIVEEDVLDLIPYSFACTYSVVPLSKKDNCLTVAIADPFDIMTIAEIEYMTNLSVDIKTATESSIAEIIDRSYEEEAKSQGGKIRTEGDSSVGVEGGLSEGDLSEGELPEDEAGVTIEEQIDTIQAKLNEIKANEEDAETLDEDSEDVEAIKEHIVELVQGLIVKAIDDGATDIHMEPKENEIQCRFRIDGILHNEPSFPKGIQSLINTRLKIMAGMDISESRLAQDGKIVLDMGGRSVDLRVATMNGLHGEKIVMRILDKNRLNLGLDTLGFNPANIAVFKNAIMKSYGIILVTGPTGSGKTTTLYSALSYINSAEKNIMTLEDPIEYELPEISQSQINLKAGITFAAGLKSLLRQDPDVILVGEMRDAETVDVAIRAATTGHLVFSTLHTNDAPLAITRLLEMGVETDVLASSLVAIIGQRLLRTICPDCKEEMMPDKELLETLKLDPNDKEMVYYHGKGCNTCHGTGYTGRQGAYEILPVDADISKLIREKATSDTIRDMAIKNGMKTILDDELEKLKEGMTTVEEIVRVSYV